MQNGPSRWKLEPPPWVALGQYEGENESLWGGCAGSDPGHQQTHKCEIHFERWAADKATQQRQKKNHLSSLDSKFLFNHFSHFALPPTQLHGSSHNFIQQVAVSFNKILLYYQNKTKMSKMMIFFFSQKNPKYCVMHVSHFTPLSLSVHQSTGSHMTHACWVCYHSYNTIFFFSPRQSSAACFLQ